MQVSERLANLLYPPACLLCHTELPVPRSLPRTRDGLLCGACAGAMPRSGPPVCERCGAELPGAFDARTLCPSCRKRPLEFEMARAPWRYAGRVQDAIRQFKYHRRWRLGRWLAEEMTVTAQASFPLHEISVVIPVPLHWLKRRLRGVNPAEQLAQTVSRLLGKPCAPHALRRTRWTATQTRLPGPARARNVQRAFLADARLVREQTALLIDDVLTSGATADACAVALKEAGARRVFVLTAARTPLR